MKKYEYSIFYESSIGKLYYFVTLDHKINKEIDYPKLETEIYYSIGIDANIISHKLERAIE